MTQNAHLVFRVLFTRCNGGCACDAEPTYAVTSCSSMNDVTSVPSVTSLSDAIEDKCVGEAAPSEYDETVKGVLPTQLEKIVPGVVNDEAAHLYSPVVKKRRLNEGEENELEQNQCAGTKDGTEAVCPICF